jgi:DNA-binding MarR family transcriptional regulator
MDDKAIRVREYIGKLIHRFMIVQNRFLQTSAAGLTTTELRAVSFVGDRKRCIMREVSDYLMIAKNNLTAMMNKLVRKGVVKRERTEEDRRLVYVSLTEKGMELYRQINDSYLDLSKGMLDALEPDEQELMLKVLHKITG